jgi:catechol O-methyltransferase
LFQRGDACLLANRAERLDRRATPVGARGLFLATPRREESKMDIRTSMARYFPFARWSVLRMGFGARRLFRSWQVGDGREAALQRFVIENARAGDLDDAIATIDRFAYTKSFLINVGDEKGALLAAAISEVQPRLLLELGTYCGYSGLRSIRAAPKGARLVTIELNPANAEVARAIFAHAGIADRATVVVGSLGDSGGTIEALRRDHGFRPGAVDFVFVDHAKDAYLPDLELILREEWLKPGAVVVADNIKVPGAPAYRAFMKGTEGVLFRTQEHVAHLEYQSLFKDIVLESQFLPGKAA